jgi:hypothetical protein
MCDAETKRDALHLLPPATLEYTAASFYIRPPERGRYQACCATGWERAPLVADAEYP